MHANKIPKNVMNARFVKKKGLKNHKDGLNLCMDQRGKELFLSYNLQNIGK